MIKRTIVRVEGEIGGGKSTLLRAFKSFLEQNGYEVSEINGQNHSMCVKAADKFNVLAKRNAMGWQPQQKAKPIDV